MSSPPPPEAGRSIDPPIDPLLAGRPHRRRADPPAPSAPGRAAPARPPRPQLPARSRARHPARGARTVALVASVTSTAGLAALIAYGDGAFDGGPALESGSPAGPVAIPGLPDSTAASGESSSAVESGTGDPDDETVASGGSESGDSDETVPSGGSDSGQTDESVASGGSDSGEADGTVASDESGTGKTDETLATGEPGAEDATGQPGDEPVATEGSGDDEPIDVTVVPATGVLGDGVFRGTAEYTEWGDVQVEVTIVDGEIADIVAVQLPSGRRSSRINDQAEPILEAEAIATQTADLDIVSGATYTSLTYADSLQAALDDAARAAASLLDAGGAGVIEA